MPEQEDDRQVTVVPFKSDHAIAFRELNVSWIERHFIVEDKDREQLNDPEGSIIGKGGTILMAEDITGSVIGCVSLVPLGGDVLELAKMAVADSRQGRGVGRKLVQAAIATARRRGVRAVYLESNRKLGPALRLYEQAGFQHVPVEHQLRSPYERCDVVMRLEL